jgi:hypothetical protein
MRFNTRSAALWTLAISSLALPAFPQSVGQQRPSDPATLEKVFKEAGYSPYAGRNFPNQVFWGNQHLHTSISLDAGAIGCRVDDELGYRFSRGEEITTSSGQPVKLSRPMDWVVISDHAEAWRHPRAGGKSNPALLADPTLKRWRDMIAAGGKEAYSAAWEIIKANSENKVPAAWKDPAVIRSAWERHVKVTERYNEPGRFTAFHGYEWTSMPGGDNLHRNVVFRDNAVRVLQTMPFSALESDNPEDLWAGAVCLRAEDRRPCARDSPQSEHQRRPHVRARGLLREAVLGPLRRRARALGGAAGGGADQGPKRNCSLPLADGRVRRLRSLGQDEPRQPEAARRRVLQE